MVRRSRKNSKIRKKRRGKKSFFRVHFKRFITIFLLVVLFGFSVCAVGYVIFFRTVIAQEIIPSIKSEVVFEEPDPPIITDDTSEVIVVPEIPESDSLADSKSDDIVEKVLPKVAIIIDDMGYHQKLGKRLLDFPFELTYSFLPFAPFTKEQERLAHRRGKTVFLHLPLQPKNSKWNPGPGTLFVNDTEEEKIEKITQCLAEVPHAVGVNNHMGSLYTEDLDGMAVLMKEFKKRSLAFLDSYTTSSSVGLRLAKEFKVKRARRHVFLDNELDKDAICTQLEKLVTLAERKGKGIGIAHPHSATVDAILSCGSQYQKRVQYVSVSELLY